MARKNSLNERVARLEENKGEFDRRLESQMLQQEKQVSACAVVFTEMRTRLETVNSEQGATRDEVRALKTSIDGLRAHIDSRVRAPMSSGDKAKVYISIISSITSVAIALLALLR